VRRSPEHSDRISSLSDDDIIRQDALHTVRRADQIRVRFDKIRQRY
jgi:hypothetical protein